MLGRDSAVLRGDAASQACGLVPKLSDERGSVRSKMAPCSYQLSFLCRPSCPCVLRGESNTLACVAHTRTRTHQHHLAAAPATRRVSRGAGRAARQDAPRHQHSPTRGSKTGITTVNHS